MINIQDKIIETEYKLKELKKELDEEKRIKEKIDWIDIGKGLEISNKQFHKGKTYDEVIELLKSNEEIASYPLLQRLRNKGLKEFRDFWVFVPNPDKICSKNNYVARFDALSSWAVLNCCGDPYGSSASLGVFLVRKIKGEKLSK